MDWLLQILLGGWWYSGEGRTKAADSADKYLLPALIVLGVVALVGFLIYRMT